MVQIYDDETETKYDEILGSSNSGVVGSEVLDDGTETAVEFGTGTITTPTHPITQLPIENFTITTR